MTRITDLLNHRAACNLLVLGLLWPALVSSDRGTQAQFVPQFEVFALTGDALPGGGPGTFGAVTTPTLNDQGDVALLARLENTGVPGDSALYRGNAAALTPIARFGDPIPGSTETLQTLSGAFINNAGQIAAIEQIGSQRTRILLFDDMAGARVVAALGDPPPVGGGSYVSLSVPTFNNAGQVAFAASFNRFGNPDQGVYLGDAGGLTEVRRGANNGTPALGDGGQLAFRSIVNDPVLFYFDGATLSEIAADGDAIPGSADTFSDFSSRPSVNAAGQVALTANIVLAGGGSGGNGVFFFDPVTGLADALPRGTAAPDGNGAFASFGNPYLNRSGQIALSAVLDGPGVGSGNDTGAYLLNEAGGNPVQIARELDPPPDGDGVFNRFDTIVLNDLGHAAFQASLRATTDGTVDALFHYSPANGLVEVIREGDPLLGSTVADFTFNDGVGVTTGIVSNVGNSFNNADQVAFSFRLADGRQGVALTGVIPEPHGLALMVVSAGSAAAGRPRRYPPQ